MNKAYLIFVLLFLQSCEMGGTTTLSKEGLKRSYPEFYLEDSEFKGLFIDYDSDEVLFSYDIENSDNKIKIKYFKTRAQSSGWIVVDENKEHIVLQRVDNELRTYNDWHSLELFRIIMCNNIVIIAGFQNDIEDEKDLINEKNKVYKEWKGKQVFQAMEEQIVSQCN